MSATAIQLREIIIELLRSHEEGEERLARAELERRLTHIHPLTLNDALARLQQRHAVRVDGEQIAASDPSEWREQLAGVALDTLVSAAPNVLSVQEIARGCKRDASVYQQREEIELALRRLVIDGLAERSAVRAQELGF